MNNVDMLKVQLDEIIKNAYYDKEVSLLERYKNFTLTVLEHSMRTRAGDYNKKTHNIRIIGLEAPEENIILTVLHEVAHHIDWCNRENSDHSAIFYAEYAKLIYSALDLGKINKDNLLNNSERKTTDHNKSVTILNNYERTAPHIISEEYLCVNVISVAFYRDILAKNGYKWDVKHSMWYKIVRKDLFPQEYKFLYNISVDNDNISLNSSKKLLLK